MRGLGTILFRAAILGFACAVLCLFVFGFASGSIAATTPSVPYLTPPKGGQWYQKDWVDVTYGTKRAKVCVANMKANGLHNAIERVWTGSPDATYGRAIACHESNGVTGAVEYGRKKGEGGACAFQIDPKSGYESVAKGIGVEPSEFLATILSDPVACAKAGRHVLVTLMNARGGLIAGLCNYVGGAHYGQYKRLGKCAMSDELLLVREYVEAALAGTEPDIKQTVQDDPTKECYGCVKLSGGKIGTMTVLNCHDYTMALSGELAKASLKYQNAVRIATMDLGKQIQKAQADSPMKNARGDIGLKYCFKDITSIYDSLMDILDKEILRPIWKAIMYVLQQISSKVCEYVLSAIDAVLEMICLPLGDFSMPNFSLPGIDSVSCDGRSLRDYISIVNAPTSVDKLLETVTGEKGVPFVNYPTYIPTSPYMVEKLTRVPKKKASLKSWLNEQMSPTQ